MSDPLRTDPVRPADTLADADREARIEQLLLSGLDQYFAGQYEQAINIWTRVVFLERGHSRARAYIERARAALAEHHRESEELLHRGMAAFSRGETDQARELITRAVEQGAPQDVALAMLERLNRLAMPAAATDGTPDPARPAPAERGVPVLDGGHARPSRARWLKVSIALALVTGGVVIALVGFGPVNEWLADPVGTPREQVATVAPEPLPIVYSSERMVSRARALRAEGELYEALRLLEVINIADPMRDEADRLRADVQRQLLSAGAAR